MPLVSRALGAALLGVTVVAVLTSCDPTSSAPFAFKVEGSTAIVAICTDFEADSVVGYDWVMAQDADPTPFLKLENVDLKFSSGDTFKLITSDETVGVGMERTPDIRPGRHLQIELVDGSSRLAAGFAPSAADLASGLWIHPHLQGAPTAEPCV